jgi:hypothetical protein
LKRFPRASLLFVQTTLSEFEVLTPWLAEYAKEPKGDEATGGWRKLHNWNFMLYTLFQVQLQ